MNHLGAFLGLIILFSSSHSNCGSCSSRPDDFLRLDEVPVIDGLYVQHDAVIVSHKKEVYERLASFNNASLDIQAGLYITHIQRLIESFSNLSDDLAERILLRIARSSDHIALYYIKGNVVDFCTSLCLHDVTHALTLLEGQKNNEAQVQLMSYLSEQKKLIKKKHKKERKRYQD